MDETWRNPRSWLNSRQTFTISSPKDPLLVNGLSVPKIARISLNNRIKIFCSQL